jgi:DNA-binding NarL/FixJ family response regulator
MQSNSFATPEVATVVIVDPMDLRRAGVARILNSWAEPHGLQVHSVPCPPPPSLPDVPPTCGMLILSVGHWSLKEPLVQNWVQALRATVPERPLVIMSDREELDEAIAAFRATACGFIPMSLDPSLAVHTFTFLMSGGSYFPPTLLSNLPGSACESSLVADRLATEISLDVGGLTRKQQQVLDLLRRGRPNKVIARALSMQEATVKVHVRQILRKLGVSNRTEAALMCATQDGLMALGRHMGENDVGTA